MVCVETCAARRVRRRSGWGGMPRTGKKGQVLRANKYIPRRAPGVVDPEGVTSGAWIVICFEGLPAPISGTEWPEGVQYGAKWPVDVQCGRDILTPYHVHTVVTVFRPRTSTIRVHVHE